jgi:putative ABC transport system ATP-binding protein
MIKCEELHKSFKITKKEEYHVLKGINLEIKKGDFIALMGPSGSGKSTLLNIIGALIDYNSGETIVNGKSLQGLDNYELTTIRRNEVGWIFQDFNLVSNLTAFENLLVPLNLAGKVGEKAKERAMELLKKVGLENWAGHFPDMLSGGQQQRVAIARALANDPPIFLADEPTGNLDTETGADIVVLFKELVSEGKAVLMVTHDIDLAKAADKVYVLRDGRLEKELLKEAI